MSSYKITRHTHGVVVTGHIPLDETLGLIKMFRAEFDIMDAAISDHYGASMVFTTKDGSLAWREELGIEGGER